MASKGIAEVVFSLPLERSFHYLVPEELRSRVEPGVRVVAPFGARVRVGFVTGLADESPIRGIKPIHRVLDPAPVIAEERWALARWLAAYYCCALGEVLAAMVPRELRVETDPGVAEPEAARPPPQALAPPVLSAHQREALGRVVRMLHSPRGGRALLLGVTGSGKTELYLQAIEHVLGQRRGAICLIPEISLTPQTLDRFEQRFGDRVAVWHSRLSARQRSRAWSRIAAGRCPVVVGARSAVFAPVSRLGLIILDEEQEATYKQEEAPRYHARDVALERARLARATCVLGSATPSIESHYGVRRRGEVLTMPERVTGQGLPGVEIVDLRESLGGARRGGPLSLPLERAIRETLERDEQVMLLLNRRGFSRTIQCRVCGAVERCAHCSVPLIYHAIRRSLLCHYCGFTREPGDVCQECRKGPLRYRGAGTERVESELHRLFPSAAIARMDRDTMRGRGSHRAVYEAVKAKAVDILVGTQMIAKGLDFPQVTLVGIVSADTALNLPDFRAGERTFDLLTQMAGRAGRGDRPGRVVVQTFCPGHYAIQAAQAHDYQRFYAQELAMRRRVRLPPFVHLVELTLVGASLPRVHEAARSLAARLREAMAGGRMDLLGPASHRVPRLRGMFRVCLLLKGPTVEPMVALVRVLLEPGRRFQGARVIVNVDPL